MVWDTEEPGEKGTHEKRGVLEPLEGHGGWAMETLNCSLTGLGFKWWKWRSMKVAEQKEHRPPRGQNDLCALG